MSGERVAKADYNGATWSSPYYYFEDELGSSRVITDAGGTVCYDADLYPFGGIQNEYLNNCPQNYKFSGKERDPETGLDEFGARYYASFLGRFVTPDWAAKPTAIPYAKFGDPQTLNLYSYVENSPVNRADADGHQQCFANGACNALQNPFSADHWIANGLSNTVSDLLSLNEVAKGTVDTVNAETTTGKLETGLGVGLLVGMNIATGGQEGTEAKGAEELAGALERTAQKVGEGSGATFGTEAHTVLREEIKGLENPNLHAEVSYQNGRVVDYGTPGSIRVDVVHGKPEAPSAISDLKTGKAKLTPARIEQIRQHLPKPSQSVPIREVRLPTE